jgi:uncharacterized membrane protein
MTKRQQVNRISQKEGNLMLEQNYIIDDNLLPSANELAKINNISSDLIKWIQEKTGLEQSERHNFNRERIRLTDENLKGTRRYNMMALCFAFLSIILCVGFSTFLIIKNKSIEGTVLGGVTITIIAYYFIKASTNRNIEK